MPGTVCDYADEWRLYADNDARADVGNERRIAHELNGVAKALFVDEQNGLAGNVALAGAVDRQPGEPVGAQVVRVTAATIGLAEGGGAHGSAAFFIAVRGRDFLGGR